MQMTRGNRGYSRGRGGSSYRGNGSSSSYRGSTNRGQTNYGSNSTRGGRHNTYDNSYDSRSTSRYQSSSSDRYSSRDDNYKRSSSYRSSRDRSPDRKRLRHEHSQGSRRSHDGFGSSSGDYSSSRYESSSYDKRDNHDQRHHGRSRQSPASSRSFRSDSNRDDNNSSSSSHRNKEIMGPPKSLPPRTIRGSYRGRGNSSRGIRNSRGMTRHNDIRSSSGGIRKRFISTKPRDQARKLKIAKLRSSIKKRSTSSRTSTTPEKKEIKKETSSDGNKDDDELTKWRKSQDKDDKKIQSSSKKIEENGEKNENESICDDDNNDIIADVTTSTKKKITPVKSERIDDETGDINVSDKEINGNSDDEDDEEDEDIEENASKSGDSDKATPKSRYTGKMFIKLTCVHCHTKCVTFKAYANHLHGRIHKLAMRRLAIRQKAQLSRMRLAQRNAQREIEDKTDDSQELRTQFCLLCRLNYRQAKLKHQMSDAHRNMKKFLMPYCTVCRINFKSPMVYEAHRCALEHIKRKARAQPENDEGSADEKELDLDNFMTVDSVGDVDGIEESELDGEKKDVESEKLKQEINVGSEHVKKVEVYYCDLCYIYLPRKEDLEASLKRHCAGRTHLRAYVRHRDDKNLRIQAERIHRKHQEQRDAKEKEDDKKETTDAKKEDNKDSEIEDNVEDKMWADVDKDLGDLLREVGPETNNDDEDEEDSRANSERYDRFKNSEKDKATEVPVVSADILSKKDDEEKVVTVKTIPSDDAVVDAEATIKT